MTVVTQRRHPDREKRSPSSIPTEMRWSYTAALKVDRTTMRIFYINISDIDDKTINMYSMAILIKYFFFVVQHFIRITIMYNRLHVQHETFLNKIISQSFRWSGNSSYMNNNIFCSITLYYPLYNDILLSQKLSEIYKQYSCSFILLVVLFMWNQM